MEKMLRTDLIPMAAAQFPEKTFACTLKQLIIIAKTRIKMALT